MAQTVKGKNKVRLADFSENTSLPDGPEWIQQYRKQAQRLYPKVEKPRWDGTRLKHKFLQRLSLDDFEFPVRQAREVEVEQLPADLAESVETTDGAVRTTVAGEKTFTRVPDEFTEKGVLVMDLADAAREHPDLLKQYFAQQFPLTDDEDYKEAIKFLALNQATWSAGTFIYVPENVELEKPIRLETLLDDETTGMSDRILLVAGENSDFNVVESVHSEGAPGERLRTQVNEVFVQDGARVRFSSLQNLQQDTLNVVFRKVTVERDGYFKWIPADLGGQFNLYYNLSEAAGEGSTADLKGVFFGSDDQRFRFQNYMTQTGPHTTTDMVAHGVLTGTCRLVYMGLARIVEGAHGASARQSEKSLILDRGARNDAVPELEIDEDDVIAEHAATVGEIDEENLYYLMTRGLSEREAEEMIVEGSFNPVTEDIENDELRNEVKGLIRKKLSSYYSQREDE